MILDNILSEVKNSLEKRKSLFPIQWLQSSLVVNPRIPLDCKPYLKTKNKNQPNIIAEVKKASPSKGILRQNFSPICIAKEYEKAGAKAISVLAEQKYFQGDIEYITQIKRYTNLPILQKDFIFDKYQILEALIYGADMILLIAAILSKEQLKEHINYAHSLGLNVLVEVHNKEDLSKAIFAKAHIIGINHRDLKTFKMNMSLCESLIVDIPDDMIIVAESGINDFATIKKLINIGVDAFLIGEYFMKNTDIAHSFSTICNLKKI